MLGVGVLGCGFWGRNHARVFTELDDCNLIAVADTDPQRAGLIGERFGVTGYSEPSKVINCSKIAFVSICTPTTTHAELALEAMAAGKHVLVEKPMTSTVDEAKELVQAAEQHDVQLMVGFIERFNPAVCKTEEIVKRGDIGELVLASSRRVSRWPDRIGDVGVIKDLAIHDIDLICHLFGDTVHQVYATAGSLAHRYEDYANIVLSFKSGKSAFIEANWLTPRKIRRLIITGTEGIIEVEYISQDVTVSCQEKAFTPTFTRDEPLQIELQYFVNSIVTGTPPQPSGEDGLKALQICEAALKSAGIHNPVALPFR